jgi:hypothetical protein
MELWRVGEREGSPDLGFLPGEENAQEEALPSRTKKGEYAQGMRAAKNFLQRTGYRLSISSACGES